MALTWAAAPALPSGVALAPACATIGGKVYVVGDNVLEYNPATATWADKGAVPFLSGSGSGGVIDGLLYYAVGGPTASPSAELWAYDPAANTWTQKASRPQAVFSHASAVLNGKLYVTGGAKDSGSGRAVYSHTFAYDPSTNTWATKATMPQQRYSHAAVASGGYVYVFGGESGLDVYLSDIHRFDPAVNTWVHLGTTSTARTEIAAAVHNGKVYLSGGRSTVGGAPLTLVQVYDTASNSVSTDTPLGTARRSHGAVMSGTDLRVLGGFDADTVRLTSHEVAALNLAPNAPILNFPSTANVNATVRFPWEFSDPDPGDSQSKAEIRYRVEGTSTWTTVVVGNPNQFWDAVAGTFTAGSRYEGQARTWDAQGKAGPWSASAFFDAVTPPPGPTLLDPISGQTISTSAYTGTISADALEASEWRLYDDVAGSIGTTELQPAVVKTTGDLRSHEWTGLVNGVTVWWWQRIKSAGLWSGEVTARTPVSFTPPPTPTLVVAVANEQGAHTVPITNPAPGAGEPSVAYNNVFVRTAENSSAVDPHRPYSDAGMRIVKEKPLNSVLVDWLTASGVVYEYRVEAVGVDGTTAFSAWTAVDPTTEPTIQYGGAY